MRAVRSIMMNASVVCLSVRLSVRQDISGTPCAVFTKFMCMLRIAVARSSSGTLMIGRITYRREGGDGSAQRGQSVICHCLVFCFVRFSFFSTVPRDWLKRTSLKWPILCRVGCKTWTQLINQHVSIAIFSSHLTASMSAEWSLCGHHQEVWWWDNVMFLYLLKSTLTGWCHLCRFAAEQHHVMWKQFSTHTHSSASKSKPKVQISLPSLVTLYCS